MNTEQNIFSAFEQFDPKSTIWIYQTDRELTPEEANAIKQQALTFAQGFKVHGSPAKATADILFGRFILFVVDNSTPASGCSIDSSVKFMKQLGEQYNIDFFNRMNISYVHPVTSKIEMTTLPKFRDMLDDGTLPSFTVIFNNTITQLQQLDGQWMIEVGDSWIFKTLKNPPILNK